MDERIFCAYATDVFRAVISIGADGESVVGWEPDLNEGGTKQVRVYTVEGRESLTDDDWGADERGEPVLPREGEHAVAPRGYHRIIIHRNNRATGHPTVGGRPRQRGCCQQHSCQNNCVYAMLLT